MLFKDLIFLKFQFLFCIDCLVFDMAYKHIRSGRAEAVCLPVKLVCEDKEF